MNGSKDTHLVLWPGKKFDFLKDGERGSTLLNVAVANPLIMAINALLNLKVTRQPASAQTNNKGQNTAVVTISDNGVTIDLYDLPAQSASSGGGSWAGEWDSDTEYSYGTFVRVSPDNAIATTEGGDTIPGTYVYNNETPSSGNEPNHPLSPGGENAYWAWISTWPSNDEKCDEAGNTIAVFTDTQEAN